MSNLKKIAGYDWVKKFSEKLIQDLRKNKNHQKLVKLEGGVFSKGQNLPQVSLMQMYDNSTAYGIMGIWEEFAWYSTRKGMRAAPSATGQLRSSVRKFSITAGGAKGVHLEGGFVSNKIYAESMEDGWGGGERKIPLNKLVSWARIKGASNPFGAAKHAQRKLNVEGFKGKKWAWKSLKKSVNDFRLPERLVRELENGFKKHSNLGKDS
jgi:hypothetical protein